MFFRQIMHILYDIGVFKLSRHICPNFVIECRGMAGLLKRRFARLVLRKPLLEYRPLVVFNLIVNPIDDVEKLPCMTNDRSDSMPLNQRLFHRPHILVRSTLHFSCPPIGTVDRYPIFLRISELLKDTQDRSSLLLWSLWI